MNNQNASIVMTTLAVIIGAGALFSTTVIAAPPEENQAQGSSEEIRLIVKRQQPDGGTGYEVVIVPAEEVDAREARLFQDPTVLDVERDTASFHPRPMTRPAPAYYQALLDGGDPVDYSDPGYSDQRYFQEGETYNSRLSEAHGRLRFTNTIRIGIVDGGFIPSPEVTFVEGSSIHRNYRGDQFYNTDPSIDCANQVSTPDTHGHFVGQIAGANSNNGLGIAGATRNVELVASRSLGCGGTGFLSHNAESVRWLAGDTVTGISDISEPVDVINMSLGGRASCPAMMQDAIDFARARNIPVVVAAGNNSGNAANHAPANCDGVITVAATKPSGAIAGYSNRGYPVAVSAQGSEMNVLNGDNEPTMVYGTSFASPLVAGVIASTLSERQNLTPAEIDTIIAESGKPLKASVTDLGVGSGILDAMLFLDGAGVPREAVTAQSALDGEREQYQAALTHPAAAGYLQAKTGTSGACELYETNGKYLPEPTSGDSIVVFSVAEGEPLDPTDSTATIINSTQGLDRLIITQADIDAATEANRQLGVAHCNVTTGANCSVRETVKAFDAEDITTPAVCS